jgi:Winged helix-turn helix
MRAGIVVNVTRADRSRLEAIVSDRGAPQKHVWRAQIILATADGCGTTEIMRRSGKAKPVVWRWQARFMAEGVDGLLRDKTRRPGKPPLPAAPSTGWSLPGRGPNSKSPSTASSQRPMPCPNPSSGPHAQAASLLLSNVGKAAENHIVLAITSLFRQHRPISTYAAQPLPRRSLIF